MKRILIFAAMMIMIAFAGCHSSKSGSKGGYFIQPGAPKYFSYQWESGMFQTMAHDLHNYLDAVAGYIAENPDAVVELSVYGGEAAGYRQDAGMEELRRDAVDYLVSKGVARDKIIDRVAAEIAPPETKMGMKDIAIETKVVYPNSQ